MSKLNNATKRTLTIHKVFDAPVQVIWEAWTDPEHIVQWWAPKGMKVSVIEHQFRVGGKWKFVMPMPDAKEFVSEGMYLEIEKFKKIITTADFRPMTEGVELQVLFEEKENQTHFTFNVVHATEEYCRQQEKMGFYNGWGSSFDRLDVLIKGSKHK